MAAVTPPENSVCTALLKLGFDCLIEPGKADSGRNFPPFFRPGPLEPTDEIMNIS